MGGGGRFAFSDSEFYINNAAYMITRGPLKYLCALLNSRLITWFMSHQARTTGMGLTVWHKAYVERIPIPSIELHSGSELFTDLVERILRAREDDPDADVSDLEDQINALTYQLYGLSAEETHMIDGG